MLDQPGEFACVNLNGGQAEFRYIPVNDADASNENPILSNLEVIWNINRATNINVKGIKFEHSSSGGKDGYNWGPQSAVRILNTHDITFDNCQFSHIGKSSIKSMRRHVNVELKSYTFCSGMTGIFARFSSKVSIERSTFFDIGFNGIHTMYQEGDDPVEDWVITNNVFDGCGTSQVISYDILCENDNYFILQCLVLATRSHVDWRLQEHNSCS